MRANQQKITDIASWKKTFFSGNLLDKNAKSEGDIASKLAIEISRQLKSLENRKK